MIVKGNEVNPYIVDPTLKYKEVRCGCNGRYCDGGVLKAETGRLFYRGRRAVSAYIGKDTPHRINSGIRCLYHNRDVYLRLGREPPAVDREPPPSHTCGEALDIAWPDGIILVDFWQIWEAVVGDGGIGFYDWGVHVDVRKTPARRRWHETTRLDVKRFVWGMPESLVQAPQVDLGSLGLAA